MSIKRLRTRDCPRRVHRVFTNRPLGMSATTPTKRSKRFPPNAATFSQSVFTSGSLAFGHYELGDFLNQGNGIMYDSVGGISLLKYIGGVYFTRIFTYAHCDVTIIRFHILTTVKSRAVDRSTIQFSTIFGVLLTEMCY